MKNRKTLYLSMLSLAMLGSGGYATVQTAELYDQWKRRIVLEALQESLSRNPIEIPSGKGKKPAEANVEDLQKAVYILQTQLSETESSYRELENRITMAQEYLVGGLTR